MRRKPCSMRPLVEARRDGRLGAREIASLERHLATCAACRAAGERLERIAARVREPIGPEVTPLDHQRNRLHLLQSATLAEPPALRPHRRRAATFAAALAVSIAALAAVVLHRSASVPTIARIAPFARHPRGRTETTVRASEGARFERTLRDGVDRIELREGDLDLEVRPLLAGERFIVATTDAEVEVRGTVFRVRAHDGWITGVEVHEGKVEVRHLGAHALIPAGGAWTPRDQPAPSADATPADSFPRGGMLGHRAHRPRNVPSARGAPASSARAPEPDAASGFKEGVSLIDRGDYAAAAEKLGAFRDANPGDPRAEDASYLAVIALQRAGQARAAAAAARRHLDLYPQSPRRAALQAILDNP